MMEPTKLLFVGGPDAGKSNYLFRIWLDIEAGQGLLRKRGLPDDLKYLSEGAAALLSGRYAGHTSRDVNAVTEIPVETTLPGATTAARVVVPDASGELWLDLFKKREWHRSWNEYLDGDTGFIIFVRAGSKQIVEPADWLTCERYYKGEIPKATLADRTPTQVHLVDWLQIIRSLVSRPGHSRRDPRLSVVVTAWDVVPEGRRPMTFLERTFPLFAQFLEANAHGFEAATFGVSVAGGNLEDKSYRDLYLAREPAHQGYGCRDVGGKTAECSLLDPVMWALGLQ